MKAHMLTIWFVCFLLKAAVLKFCQAHRLDTNRIVYLDSTGFAANDIGECSCTLSIPTGTLVSVNITTLVSKQGDYALLVDGNTVQTPVNVSFTSNMDILLRKPLTGNIYQCLYVAGSWHSSFNAVCTQLRNLTYETTSRTETATTTQSSNNTASTVPSLEMPTTTQNSSTIASTVAPSETPSTIESDNTHASTVAPSATTTTSTPSDSIQASTVAPTGIIAGAAAGGISGIIIIVVIVTLVLRRIRKSSTNKDEPSNHSHSTEDPEYDMTVNGGYVSADYVDNPRQDAQRPDEIYEDNADAAATSETFNVTDHGASDYAVVTKSRSKKSDRPNDLDEETEYNSLTETILIRPTENMYGVALPIQPNYSDS